MAKRNPSPHQGLQLLCCLILSLFVASNCDSIQELLISKGLPMGLLPKSVKSFTLDDTGRLEVFLESPCFAKFDNRVYFESVISANLSYGELTSVAGLSQEELFVWLPVKDIKVDDPSSGLIFIDIVVAHKQLSLSLFEDPLDCKPESQGVLWNNGRKGKGFDVER
eukprot:TRINITY_DN20490_c0_g1_i1.p1 TRINITY_DN20490_c0_g1~~TRINITY_DN20490_c0_g1_i1.p1  ORF type:complete len:166 (+),score=20.57 TRINITY_DN20490_c0_g1_i1:65-562(+)